MKYETGYADAMAGREMVAMHGREYERGYRAATRVMKMRGEPVQSEEDVDRLARLGTPKRKSDD